MNERPNDLGEWNDIIAIVFIPFNLIVVLSVEVHSYSVGLKSNWHYAIYFFTLIATLSVLMPSILYATQTMFHYWHKNFYLGHEYEIAESSIFSTLFFGIVCFLISLYKRHQINGI
jgi:hypothetical protein